MCYLKIENIKKSFDNKEILKDINIEIEKGEFVCFLGPSGCGKTTTLRIIAGLEKEDSGIIKIGGKDISSLTPGKRNIGIVFQNYALFPNMTVFENIAYGLVNKGLKKDKINKKVLGMIETVDLKGQEEKYPSQLSGGQQQRVAIARAVVLEPDILLLDEPLSALDAKVRESLRIEIKDLQRKLGITTILVTHDQEEAVILGDKVIVFNEGKVMQIGKPEEIYYMPANDFVADFIGKTNFIDINNEKRLLRPECIDYSVSNKLLGREAIVKKVDFRITNYRVLLSIDGIKDICIDMSWKEVIKGKIEVGKTIYVDLNDKTKEFRNAN